MNVLDRLALWMHEIPERRFGLLVFVALAIVIFIVYLPALTAFFISDDFSYVNFLYFEISALLDGQKWDLWFLSGIDGNLYLRPAGHLFFLIDYLMWGLNPLGYHLTNILLHLSASFAVFVLTRLATRNPAPAIAASVLFAVLPVHAGAVAWPAARYDLLAGFFYLTSLIFYMLSRRNEQIRWKLLSLALFAIALTSKETATTLPMVVLFYEVVLNWRECNQFKRKIALQLPYWLVLVGYLIFRSLWGTGFGYRGIQIIPEGIAYWADVNLLHATEPFLTDLAEPTRLALFVLPILLLLISRIRRKLAFGLLWIAITLAPTLASGPSDRSFYLPSVGLVWVLTTLGAWLYQQPFRGFQFATRILFVTLLVVYASALYARNQVYNRAGQVAEAIPQQVKALQPNLPSPARLIFVGVPDRTPEGVLIYLTGFPGLLRTMYPDTELQTIRLGKFPVWLDQLDRTFFFQVDHRRVTERADLVSALQARQQCAARSYTALVWDFANGAQGWELVNDLSDAALRDGALILRATGTDPNLVSPPIEIPSIAMGDIIITMRVRAAQSKLRGEVYWRASGDSDFSPGQRIGFDVRADGEYHTYSLDIAQTGSLAIGDRIAQLRLDPADAPAEIALKEIRVFMHCSAVKGEQCECPAPSEK